MGSWGGSMMVAALVAVVMAAQVGVGGAMIIHIGGNTGWTPDKNYTDWSNRHKVYVEDWLMFWYANGKEQYDVVEVNQSNYDSCNGQDFIQNITRGYGRDVFHLTEPKTYYFICSKGNYCRDGMKLAVTAHERPSPALELPPPALQLPPPLTKSNSVPKNTLTKPIIFIVMLCLMLV